MELEISSEKVPALLIKLMAENLCTLRKLSDIVLITISPNEAQAIAAMKTLRSESAKATKELIQAIWANDGHLDIDKIFGDSPDDPN